MLSGEPPSHETQRVPSSRKEKGWGNVFGYYEHLRPAEMDLLLLVPDDKGVLSSGSPSDGLKGDTGTSSHNLLPSPLSLSLLRALPLLG